MTSPSTRRSFLRTSLTTAAAIGAAAPTILPFALPSRVRGDHHLSKPNIGLSQYSLRQLFSSKKLDILDYPKFASDNFGITEIDVWDGGLPPDKRDDPKFLAALKKRADDNGSNIFLWMAGVVHGQGKTLEDRKKQAKFFKPAIDNAAALGCKYIRVFLRAPDGEQVASAKLSAETLEPIADYAASKKLIVAIEPGASKMSSNGNYLVEVMKQLKHDHCKLMPDFGKFSGHVVEYTKAMMPYTAVVSAKSHNFDEQGNEKGFDYHALMKVIKDAKFKGIVAIEYEGSKLGPVEGVKATQALIKKAWAKA